MFVVGAREDAIDFVDQRDEAGGLAVAGMRNVYGKVGVNVSGVAAKDDDAIGENDRFFDIMRNDENGARGNLVPEPEFQKFAAQRFRSEYVERGERLVHEKHFRLDDQRTGHADALLHAAGKFLGIRGLEPVEADRVNNAQRALVPLDRNHAARFERGFHVFENGEPREKREALKNNGNVWRAIAHRCAVPEDGAGARGGKSGEHAQQSGFSAAGCAEHGDDLARVNGEIGGGDHLNAAAIGLRIKLFQFARFDDGFRVGGVG